MVKHDCMTLGSIQTPDCKTLDNMGKNLVCVRAISMSSAASGMT
ncbi:MAG: hypothetical protein PARBB_03318 [Parabacteroides distasonis]